MSAVSLINTLFFLQKICITVEVSERSVEKLLADVSQLKEEIKRKKQQNCSGKLTKRDASLALPKLTQLTEAENTPVPETAKTAVVQEVLQLFGFFFPRRRQKSASRAKGECSPLSGTANAFPQFWISDMHYFLPRQTHIQELLQHRSSY